MKNTKIKIICGSNCAAIERQVNYYLETLDVIDIKYQPVVYGSGTHFEINDRIMIVYVDDGE